MEHAVHDRGGWPTDEPIDLTEHELADWELLMDAIVGALGAARRHERRRVAARHREHGPAAYEAASYYERWLFAAETILAEKGVVTPASSRRARR